MFGSDKRLLQFPDVLDEPNFPRDWLWLNETDGGLKAFPFKAFSFENLTFILFRHRIR
ncbi:hypothetical protein KR51_00007070 [Rubidibacter lacunae KORDI 51-2]|uniref:Uncharacterized protein n=1 Tax=Rubidibacter lacunae KORDI 51-2 TaxID=582515 RepID=U5DPU5_9CHRO|nr:hypothetical protein KR51_00007070 [Rubidibacter lacunae KORDI 51-2]